MVLMLFSATPIHYKSWHGYNVLVYSITYNYVKLMAKCSEYSENVGCRIFKQSLLTVSQETVILIRIISHKYEISVVIRSNIKVKLEQLGIWVTLIWYNWSIWYMQLYVENDWITNSGSPSIYILIWIMKWCLSKVSYQRKTTSLRCYMYDWI
jgi:hypothetical protein